MASDFETAIEQGLELSKRLCYGKEPLPPPPQTIQKSQSSPGSFLPTAATVYAVVSEPEDVDNPDLPSYQPYVHGRCEPPALIPLQMMKVGMEIECWLDHATVTLSGSWRVHCIKSGRRCGGRVAVPMGELGSLLGVEVDVLGRSYHSQLVPAEENEPEEKVQKGGDGWYIKSNLYTFKIPQVEGGSTVSIRVTWSQKLTYNEGLFCLHVPFSFPSFVNPIGRKISKIEKILLDVNSGTDREILLKNCSHTLKELSHDVGKSVFMYEAEVARWSSVDFKFSYTVSFSDIYGGVLSQSQFLRDSDDRNMFCLYIFPGTSPSWKAFRKKVIFLIDVSGSMKGDPLERVNNALVSFLSKLDSQDLFNIIAFNEETYLFSSSMEPATQGSILKAIQWLSDSLIAVGGTNIFLPLKQAINLLAETTNSIPLIFLITDGTVDDERNICNFVKDSLARMRPISPRICTFGIGTYCNHYFLRMLAQIGRGEFDCAYDTDSIDFRLPRFYTSASSILISNLTINNLQHLDSLGLLPSDSQDLSSRNPLIMSGRYYGQLPESIRITGLLPDMNNFTMDLRVQKAKDVPLDRVLARRQIDSLTANAWFLESKDLVQKVVKKSIQVGLPSEYTHMVLIGADSAEKAPETVVKQEVYHRINPLKKAELEAQKIIILGRLGVGFGNLTATAKNIPSGTEEPKPSDPTDKLVKAASNYCSQLVDRCCCMCFIDTCSKINNQCSTTLSQLCAALACFQCVECCYDLCS